MFTSELSVTYEKIGDVIYTIKSESLQCQAGYGGPLVA